MITYIDTPYGYYSYNIDNLWTGLSQMGNIDNEQES